MKAAWIGIFLCALVIYFGIVHSMGNPMLLLNAHAVILVLGGTIAISFLTYTPTRLAGVIDYLLFGFLFRVQKTEIDFMKQLIVQMDLLYGREPSYQISHKMHPFIKEATDLLQDSKRTAEEMHEILMDRRNTTKRKYLEDAKILGNIAKYPPHLGLLGAASGMIEMMSGLGKVGVDSIGGAMAIALSATLWGVGLNNFVFLPLADHSLKVSEDDIYMRDIAIHCFLKMKRRESHHDVLASCLDKLTLSTKATLKRERIRRSSQGMRHAG